MGYIFDRSPVHHRADTKRQATIYAHNSHNLVANETDLHVFGLWEDDGRRVRTPNCKAGFEPRTLLLLAIRCSAVPPLTYISYGNRAVDTQDYWDKYVYKCVFMCINDCSMCSNWTTVFLLTGRYFVI